MPQKLKHIRLYRVERDRETRELRVFSALFKVNPKTYRLDDPGCPSLWARWGGTNIPHNMTARKGLYKTARVAIERKIGQARSDVRFHQRRAREEGVSELLTEYQHCAREESELLTEYQHLLVRLAEREADNVSDPA